MRFMRLGIWLVAVVLAAAGVVHAQSTTGTISGRVVDTQERTMPGVTVSVESPNLQGIRTAVTSENGDYIFTLLPSGQYTITFELSGFEGQKRTVTLAPTQAVPVDVTMGLAGVSETVEVVGRAADVLTQTAQVAANLSSALLSNLPTTRDLNAYMLMAPSVNATGPGGQFSIAGAMSFENLYMINGVTVNENVRGQAFNLYIEDAIQETTVATAGVSAEYGRFGGGVVNMITKSGGNQFSGSFRDSLNNDRWRTLVPNRPGDAFGGETDASRVDDVVPAYEYTFGGPVVKDRLWFFTAGRLQELATARQLVITNIPYVQTIDSKRYEGNATYSLNSNHRFQGTFIKETLDELNNTFSTQASMDLRSLANRQQPQDLFTMNYSGIFTPQFFVEARYSRRNFTFVGNGAPTNDLIEGTLLLDQGRQSRRYWSPTFCGVCSNEDRDNTDFFVKGTYFLSTSKYGSHTAVVGFDTFNDIRLANNHQSGSDYRILGTTSIITANNDIFPVFLGNGTTIIQWNPIALDSIGSDFRTNSLFFNDSWRISNRLTANLGIRYDKNDGKNQAGELVAKDDAISPRFGVIYDPTGTGDWSVTASYGRYVAAVANTIAGQTSAAGNPATWQFQYRGADINGGGAPVTSTPDAIRQVFDWYGANSGCVPQDNNCIPTLATNGAPTLPGVASKIGDSLTTPNNWEYAAGINRHFGSRATIRADYIFRDFQDFYVARTDLSTGRVKNSLGREFDLTLIENTNLYERRYSGLTTQATYRFGARTDIGANYTISHTWGNVDGENTSSGPVTGSILQYPEYIEERWFYPSGDLQNDQRHRARLWINYGVPRVNGLTLSLLQALESGVPYSAGGIPQSGASPNGVNPSPWITNPGYVSPPIGTTTQYYYTARDAFRTEGQRRTDFAANYTYDVNAGGRRIGLYVGAQVINIFNQFQLCGCGATVFAAAGTVSATTIDQTVRNNVNTPSSYAAFNPFTTTPVEGENWAKGPNFGHALNRFAYTSPRQFRLTFGIRF